VKELEVDAGFTVIAELGVDLLVGPPQPPEALAWGTRAVRIVLDHR
jgi:hypothetical protein